MLNSLVNPRDIIAQSANAIRAHKLRAALTILGLTMGVATLITVMTLVRGANRYVETKVANLGTNVFQVARTPFTVTDFNLIMKSIKYQKIEMQHVEALAEACAHCDLVGATANSNARARYHEEEVRDVSIIGHTANMSAIDTRTVEHGRYFTPTEDQRSAPVCLIGATVREQLFPSVDPLNRTIHIGATDCTVVGVFEKIGSLLGQDQDKYVIVPMQTFLRLNGRRSSLTINVKASEAIFQQAQDEIVHTLRAMRHVPAGHEDDFFIATKESYIALWRNISSAFFAVFVMVSAISAIVGGIVIMNVMLMSVTERRKEIGIRRAVGATQADIRWQFLTESLMQCLVGGSIGILFGFLFALAVRTVTSFPADVETWVVGFGLFISTSIGLFFGIYPAVRASRLDPVVALRAD